MNSSFFRTTFTPKYPGEFVIKWMGVKKTVDVTGYKEVSLNSTGISLIISPPRTELRDRDYVRFNLSVINENPYPVKIPVFDPIAYSRTPYGNRSLIYSDWVWSHFEIESNSQRTIWSQSFLVRYPKFSLYVYVYGRTVSVEVEVKP